MNSVLAAFVWSSPSTWLGAMWQSMKEGLASFWTYLSTMVTTWADTKLGALWDLFPTDYKYSALQLKPYFRLADDWVAVSFAFHLFEAYMLFLTAFTFFRWIKKFIPFLSG